MNLKKKTRKLKLYLVLNLGLHIGDCVVRLDNPCDRLSHEGLDENLHGTTSKSKDKMEGRFLLDVVVREGSASKEQNHDVEIQ